MSGDDSYPDARPLKPQKGRGAVSNLQGRYEVLAREAIDDGWSPGNAETDAGADNSADADADANADKIS